MSRLPTPGHDAGKWGDILNEYLSQAHKTDGTLKNDTVGAAQLQDNAVTETVLSSAVQAKLNQTAPVTKVNNQTGDVTITKTDIGLANVDNTADSAKPISTAQQAALDLKADATVLTGKLNTTDLDAQTAGNITAEGTATRVALSSVYGVRDRGVLTFGRKIGFIGDSHTEAMAGVTNSKYGFPRQTLELLGGWFASETGAIFAGIGGERSDQITARVDTVLNQGVDVLVYEAGANDANQNFSTQQYLANVAAAVQKCKERGVIPVIVGVPPSNNSGTSQSQRWREFYNLALASYCTQNNIEFADIYPILIDPATNFQRAELTNGVDGHILDRGHWYIAVELSAAIRRTIGANSLNSGYYGLYNQIIAPWLSGAINTLDTYPDGWSLQASSGPSGVTASTQIVADQWDILPAVPFGGTVQANRWFEVTVNNTDLSTTLHREFQVSITTRGVVTDTMAIGCYLMVEDMGGTVSYADGILAHTGTRQRFTPRANGAEITMPEYNSPGWLVAAEQYARGPVWRTFQFGSANTQVARWIIDVGPQQHLKMRLGLPVVKNLTYSGYPGSDLTSLLA